MACRHQGGLGYCERCNPGPNPFAAFAVGQEARIVALEDKLRRVRRIYWTVRWQAPDGGSYYPSQGRHAWGPRESWGPHAGEARFRSTRAHALTCLRSARAENVRGTHHLVRVLVLRKPASAASERGER